jgi:hypothetical protein
MPDNWDATVYCQRAAAWRQRAAALRKDDDQQDACVATAEGYERLATFRRKIGPGNWFALRQPVA